MALRILLGLALLVTGIVWFFQGLGAIEGYGMTGHGEWTVIGAMLIVIAVGLLLGAKRLHDDE